MGVGVIVDELGVIGGGFNHVEGGICTDACSVVLPSLSPLRYCLLINHAKLIVRVVLADSDNRFTCFFGHFYLVFCCEG